MRLGTRLPSTSRGRAVIAMAGGLAAAALRDGRRGRAGGARASIDPGPPQPNGAMPNGDSAFGPGPPAPSSLPPFVSQYGFRTRDAWSCAVTACACPRGRPRVLRFHG
jgi:hypothetical protein